VTERWEGVLEILKERSRRHHAIFEPAVPVAASGGILVLRYGRRYAAFHAVQARTGELTTAVTAALERACGVRLKIDVKVEGEDTRRRPTPPSLTPADARTPVEDGAPFEDGAPVDEDAPVRWGSVSGAATADAPAAVETSDEEVDVREAEFGASAPDDDVDALLADELDARLVDEDPPSGGASGG
jgi:DNA polymerase III subunit gamma/tau